MGTGAGIEDWKAISLARVPEDVAHSFTELDRDGWLVCVASRMTLDGRFGESWFAAGPRRVAVVTRNTHPARVEWSAAMEKLTGARTQNVSGGGVLVLDVEGRPQEVLRYDSGQAALLGGIAQRIHKQVRPKGPDPKEEAAQAPELVESPPPLDFVDLLTKQRERYCARCGFPFFWGTKVCRACVPRRSTLLRTLAFARPFAGRLALMGGLMVLGMVLQLIPPQLVRFLVDEVLASPSQAHWLVWTLAGMGLVMALQLAVSAWHGRMGVWIGCHITSAIQKQIYAHLQTLSLSYFNRQGTGTLMARINGDTREMQTFLSEGIQYTIVNLLLVVGIAGMMLWMNPLLGLMVLLPAPLVVALTMWVWRRSGRRYAILWKASAAFSAYLNDALSGVRVVKAFGQERTEIGRFKEKNERLRERRIEADQSWFTLMPLMNLLVQSSVLLVWYFGAYEVYGKRMTLGALMAYLGYLSMFFGPLQLITRMNQWLSSAITAAARVFEILDTQPEVQEKPGARALERVEGRIELRDVVYGYEKHQPVIHKLTLEIKPGEMIGLVGSSGAGKSTLMWDPLESTCRHASLSIL